MTIKAPSQQWVSQRLAVLESVANSVDRQVHLLCIPYFLALGFFIQCWIKANFGTTAGLSFFDTIGLPISVILMVVLSPALLAMIYVTRTIRNRI